MYTYIDDNERGTMGNQAFDLIQQGEGLSVEFKRCGSLPERDTFETICSFANRQGGHIILGVNDNGSVEGINEGARKEIERNIVNVTSNPDLFNVAPELEFFHEVIDDKYIIDLWVPMGPSVYRYKGVAYDRVADVDIRLKSDEQIAALYLRKQNLYTEQRVYSHVSKNDLDLSLIDKARVMIKANKPNHPWLLLDDDAFMRAARFRTKDYQSGEEGFNLASILLFGRDETILSVCPVYRTDATLRKVQIERYDDRMVVSTNLIDSYYQLNDFCVRWLPDSFVLDGNQRVSARDIIVRELVVNTLIHREYSSPFISQLTIDSEGIKTKNASRCMYSMRISPENLSPTPKNPIIANFFTQIGLSEELGSGTRKLYRYSKLYTGKEPILSDGDFFNAVVPVPGVGVEGGLIFEKPNGSTLRNASITTAINELFAERECITSKELANHLNVNQRTARRYLNSLIEAGVLAVDKKGRSTIYRQKID